jgi:hypothetical protein
LGPRDFEALSLEPFPGREHPLENEEAEIAAPEVDARANLFFSEGRTRIFSYDVTQTLCGVIREIAWTNGT